MGWALSLLFLPQLMAQDIFFTESPTISPDGQTVVFSYDGDLWIQSAESQQATRLTGMKGNESFARISPDGKWVAFSASQYGNPDVFLMPMAGGEIKRLTWHSGADLVSTWSWNSKEIYFTSSRYNRQSTYSVNIDGGTPKRLVGHYFNQMHNLAVHPKSGAYYFNESWESSNQVHRKRYKGAYNPDIKSYDPKRGTYKQLTDYEGKDFWPMFDKKGTLYFLSDENTGEYNLFTMSSNGKKKALTKFESSIKRPQVSANGEKVVFERDYQLFIYDTKSGKTKALKTSLAENVTLAQSQSFQVSGNVSAFDVSQDKKKLAFVSRGELFVSDIKGKFVRHIPTQSLGRVMEIYWLNDDRTLLFNQTVNGYQNWFTIRPDRAGSEKAITSDMQNNRLLSLNHERTQGVYFSGREEVRMLDLESLTSTPLLKEELWGFYNDRPRFSPDDRYLAFTAYRNFEREIFVYDLEEKKKHNLTQTGVSEAAPFWSPDGKYIFFQASLTQPNYPFGADEESIYRLPLTRMEAPFRQAEWEKLFEEEENKEDKKEEAKDKDKDKDTEKEEKSDNKDKEKKSDKDKVKVEIDFNDPMDRIERISPRVGSQQGVYVVQAKKKTMVFYVSNHDEGKFQLWKTTYEDFEESKTEVVKGVTRPFGLEMIKVKDSYYAMYGGNVHSFNPAAGKMDQIKLSHRFQRQLQSEFEQMFYELWANLEENFYNESFHGENWQGIRDRYATFLPHLTSRNDLRVLITDMLGELNSSHLGFGTFGREEGVFYNGSSAETGILFKNDQPFVVDRIVAKSRADVAGKDIKAGDRLVAVQGQRIVEGSNRETYFNFPNRPDEITLVFERDGKEHTVYCHTQPTFALTQQLYDEWQAENQAYVDKKTNKRVAYIHMKNMGGGELGSFQRQIVREFHQRDALILDLRWNTGGNVHDRVLNALSRKPYLNWKYREGELAPQPNFSPSGKPIILLTNEQSLSDAEMTAQGFKALGLGKIVGMETYRWIIFTSGKGLVDGSFYRLPAWGCYSLDGKNLEKTGVSPDIEVPETFEDRLKGRQPQLDRAIEEIMRELK